MRLFRLFDALNADNHQAGPQEHAEKPVPAAEHGGGHNGENAVENVPQQLGAQYAQDIHDDEQQRQKQAQAAEIP